MVGRRRASYAVPALNQVPIGARARRTPDRTPHRVYSRRTGRQPRTDGGIVVGLRARAAAVVAGLVVAAGIPLGIGVGTAHADGCPVVALDGTLTPAATTGVNWMGCNLAGADFAGANLAIADLTGADLTGADLTGTTLLATNLTSANLTGADLTGATVSTGVRLRGSVLTSAVITGVDLSSVLDLSYVTSGGLVGTPSALPSGWLLRSGYLIGTTAHVQNASLPGVDLSGMDLTDADFTNADLSGANLSGTSLFGVLFFGTNLLGADLTGATATAGIHFRGTTCPDGTNSDWHNGLTCFGALDSVAPTARMHLPVAGFATSTVVSPAWVASDAGSLVASVQVRFLAQPVGGGASTGWLYRSSWHFPRETTAFSFVGRLATRYCFSVQARDNAGNVGSWSPSACISTPVDDRSLAGRTGWVRTTGAGWLGSTLTSSTRRGATLSTTRSITTHQVGVIAYRCPRCGSVAVYVGATKVGTLALARSTSGRALLLLPRSSRARTGAIRLVVTTSGRPVRIDALMTSYG